MMRKYRKLRIGLNAKVCGENNTRQEDAKRIKKQARVRIVETLTHF